MLLNFESCWTAYKMVAQSQDKTLELFDTKKVDSLLHFDLNRCASQCDARNPVQNEALVDHDVCTTQQPVYLPWPNMKWANLERASINHVVWLVAKILESHGHLPSVEVKTVRLRPPASSGQKARWWQHGSCLASTEWQTGWMEGVLTSWSTQCTARRMTSY